MLTIIATITLVVCGLWVVQHVRDRRRAAEHEAYYQSVVSKYTGEFTVPGATREQVEQRLQADGRRFKQMCCVANYRGEYVSFVGAGWDDLVKIGEESTPWFCSENSVYIGFEFNPKSQGELPKTNGSDILKRVSIFHQLEGCL